MKMDARRPILSDTGGGDAREVGRAFPMHSSVYLKHYRLPTNAVGASPGSPLQGTFKATDSRSGAPVSLTLIPVDKVPEAEREDFERRAHALTQFDHLHVARLVEFGRDKDV